MHASLDCIPCFVRQALEAARFVTDDTSVHERVVRDVLRTAAGMDLAQSPPVVGQRIHRDLRRLTGSVDPYRPAKDRFNRMALAVLPGCRRRIDEADDPLRTALRLAIAANVIDLGVDGSVSERGARRALDAALHEPFRGDVEGFRQTVEPVDDILYLADNAGEIVLDRLLIEQLRPERVTVAVRGAPVLNDATRDDAAAAGLDEIVEVIDNGSDAPGTILSDCNAAFRRRFAEADLVIAKGQGNYETLSDAARDVYFLFKVKCPVIASHAGLPVGTHAALRTPALMAPAGGQHHAGI
ncbi:MAG: damage-control phosphatase ARMT1 family protein [Planctomycetota bacterium]